MKENAPLSGLPKISAGDTLQSGCGVFLICRRDLSNLLLFSDPVALAFSIMRRLHFFHSHFGASIGLREM